MKIAAIILRTLLGLAFAVFGLNMLHDFMHMPMPAGDAGTYMGLLYMHKYLVAIGLVQLLGGLLTLSGRFTPLGLIFLGPVLVNILLFHTLFGQPGIINGIVLSVIELFLIYAYRPNFAGIFSAPTVP